METPVAHVVGRVGALLRAVAAAEPDGITTTAAGRGAGVPRATAHRLLVSLADEGMVERSSTGSWFLGPQLYLLGVAASKRYDVTDLARGVVTQLARDTGESAFFSARQGDQTVCLLEVEGSFPLRSHVLNEGVRFPLGVASAGLVILAHLSERESAAYLARTDLAGAWGTPHGRKALGTRLEATREAGYAVNPGLVVEGSWGMAAAVFDTSGDPRWAISLTGVESRFREERQPRLGKLLLDAAHALSRELARRPTRDREPDLTRQRGGAP